MEPYKILMIDDSAELRRILHTALEDTAVYVVVETGTIAEGRALLADERPDLLILDAELPDGSGFDFCREVRMESDIPILFSSGLAAPCEQCGLSRLAFYLTDTGKVVKRLRIHFSISLSSVF